MNVQLHGRDPLVDQIVEGIKQQIDERHLRPGGRVPSIRGFAETHKVSRFTVVEAYDRLVALGYLESRRGSGFYATSRRNGEAALKDEERPRTADLVWLIRRLLTQREGVALAGAPWIPSEWLDEAGMRRALRTLSREKQILDFGDPRGHAPLRSQLELMLAELDIPVSSSQILLTEGTSQALDLIMRRLLRPGDTALVDDPGYYNLFGNLRQHGVRLAGVPRGPDGPDTATLERLARQHQPKVYFTQSVMQNPTGTAMSPHVAFRVLQIAERCGFAVVEDDVCCDLDGPGPRLATLDRLNRVIYVRSFSKTLAGSLRVGFIACRGDLAAELLDLKMLTSITSSQLAERLVHAALVDGHYRKSLTRLRERIRLARERAVLALERAGMELFVEPKAGMFLWARFGHIEDSLPLAEEALAEGVMLAPGTVFRPGLEPSPWMRFNVAMCEDPRVRALLERIASRA